MEGLPTEIAAEDRSLTETSAKRRGPTHRAAKSSADKNRILWLKFGLQTRGGWSVAQHPLRAWPTPKGERFWKDYMVWGFIPSFHTDPVFALTVTLWSTCAHTQPCLMATIISFAPPFLCILFPQGLCSDWDKMKCWMLTLTENPFGDRGFNEAGHQKSLFQTFQLTWH